MTVRQHFQLIALLLFAYFASCITSTDGWHQYTRRFMVPELRVFCEPGILADESHLSALRVGGAAGTSSNPCTDANQIIAVRIYGMRILEDGSEQALWNRTLELVKGKMEAVNISYDVWYTGDGTVYFVDNFDFPTQVFKLDAYTGECVESFHVKAGKDTKYNEIDEQLSLKGKSGSWQVLHLIRRPDVPYRGRTYTNRILSGDGNVHRWPDGSKWQIAQIQDIQVRVFFDKGVVLPDGKVGHAHRIFGMRVLPDGSESVVWVRTLDSFVSDGHIRMVKLLLPNPDILYIEHAGCVYKVDIRTGKLLAFFRPDASSGHEFAILNEFLEKYDWSYPNLMVRPMSCE